MRSTRSVLLIVGAGFLFMFFLVIAQGPAPEAASDATSDGVNTGDGSPIPANEDAKGDDALAMASRFGALLSSMIAAPASANESDEAEDGTGEWMNLPAQFVAMHAEEDDQPDATRERNRSQTADGGGEAASSGFELRERTPHEDYVRAVIALREGRTLAAVEQFEGLLDAFAGDRTLRAEVRLNLARAQLALAKDADAGTSVRSGAGAHEASDGAIQSDGTVSAEAASETAPSRRSAHLRQALSLSEEALALAPSSEAWNVRGLALLAAQRGAESIAAFEKAVALDPSNVHAQNNLGYVRILRGDHAGAIAPLQAGRDAAEQSGAELPAHLLNNLGVALEATGAFEEASDAFRAAADAGHPHASVSLARVEERVRQGDSIASAAETLAVR